VANKKIVVAGLVPAIHEHDPTMFVDGRHNGPAKTNK
jgi:hypothetical protein